MARGSLRHSLRSCGLSRNVASLSDRACDAFVRANGFTFDAPGTTMPAAGASAEPRKAGGSKPDFLALPYLFVIDGHGVVRVASEGYSPSDDPIVAALHRLGVR